MEELELERQLFRAPPGLPGVELDLIVLIVAHLLQPLGRQFLIVATKSDRLSGSQLQRSLQTLQDEYGGARVLPYSARSGSGREELWKEIRWAAESNRQLRRA